MCKRIKRTHNRFVNLPKRVPEGLFARVPFVLKNGAAASICPTPPPPEGTPIQKKTGVLAWNPKRY